MTNAPPSLLPCLAAAAVSGIVSLDEATPFLSTDDVANPSWPSLRRRLSRRARSDEKAAPVEALVRERERVLWHGRLLGTVVVLYRDVHPQEQQARIAYDTFVTRFFDYLYATHHCVVMTMNDAAISLFAPANSRSVLLDLWNDYVAHVYSMPELRRTFLGALNAVKLSNRGFSPPDVPPVTKDHAVALLGLYNATVMQRDADMRTKRRNIDNASGAGERERLRRELAKNEANYRGAITKMAALVEGLPKPLRRSVKEVTDSVTRTGRSQIGTRADYIEACVDRAQAVRDHLDKKQFALLRPLLSTEPPMPARREAGDANGTGQLTCYICGVALGKKEGVEVSKLVVEKPSQALQSRPREQRPLACPTCIQVSMLSPIKPTDGAVIVSLRRPRSDGHRHDHLRRDDYLYDDHLRQMALGELNLVAGRYCQITCTERVERRDLLSQKLGAVQYALLKTAHLFPPDTLRDYMIVVSVGGGEVETPRRQMAALSGLLGMLSIAPANVAAKKSNLGAFSDAVRLLQADRYVEATYELLGAFRRGPDLNAVAMTQLDALAGVIIETWRNEHAPNGKETLPMTDTKQQPSSTHEDDHLRTYRDVLALTGLIAPFIQQVQRTPSGTDRELKKLIEHVENDVAEFCYDLAQALPPFGKTIPSAPMSDARSTHTIVKEALSLLKDAGVDVMEQSSAAVRGAGTATEGLAPRDVEDGADGHLQASSSYSVNIDMLQGVYLHLYKERYHTPKMRRDLAYQVKLSLYARFPRLVSTAN